MTFRFSLKLLIAHIILCSGWACSTPANQHLEHVQKTYRSKSEVNHDQWPDSFNIGRPVTEDEIALWDTDVTPDGHGLPTNSKGTSMEGKKIYLAKCAVCHGITGVEGPFNQLVSSRADSSFNFANDPHMVKTIGNFWPYATTLYDYINRAMPQNKPGTLTSNEVYSLVAYLLYRNRIIPKDFEMNATTLPKITMPALSHFVPDDRKGGAEIR